MSRPESEMNDYLYVKKFYGKMLDSKLQPSVDILIEQNRILSNDYNEAMDKIHELMTENSYLKSNQTQFRNT